MISNLIKQPLFHFLLIGAAFFLLYHLTVKNNYPDTDLKTVIVDKNSLLKFMQYRSKKFNPREFENKLKNMPQDELNKLMDEYVREEVLYREALALGMDKEDYLIRRRMIQKIEFINEELVNSSQNITEKQARDYFEQNRDSYKIEPNATFTHVYFSNDRHGKENANKLSENELAILNNDNVQFFDSVKHGDRFLYHLNYVERTPEFIESHFGKEMSEEIFKLSPSDSEWSGPFESPYGYHLVMLTNKEDEQYPELYEVYDMVIQELNYKLSNEARENSIKEIIDGYEVKILYNHGSGSADGPGK